MKRIKLTTVAVLALLYAGPAHATINVFACEPEWGALAKEIGGDHVKIYTATKAHQDVHYMRAKPSLLAAVRKADLIFCSGASLESGWLPILLKKAGGPDVQPNTKGWLMASDFVRKLGVMTHNVDRSMGHIHPEGNPHVHLNPNNLLEIADMLAERLIILDQRNLSTYDTNLSTFKQKWSVLINEWNASASMLKGKKVIVYHKSWSYLLDWLGVDILTTLEPKPGLPPTSAHLETVLQTVKGQDVLGILVAPFENDKAAIWLSEKSDIPILHLPYTVGGDEQVTDLESLFTQSIKLLKEGSI